MKLDELSRNLTIENPRQALWVLFRSHDIDLSDKQALGMLLFDLLTRMGYNEGQATFIVITSMEWAYKEVLAERPAILQLLDQSFLTYFGEPVHGFHAWDLKLMREAAHYELPKKPLVSVGISLLRLYEDRVKSCDSSAQETPTEVTGQ